MGTVDTKRVQGRRALRFGSLDEAVADAARLAEAEREGRLTALGNWTLGQTFGHLAAWAGYPFDGYPAALPTPPLPVRLMGPLLKRHFLRKGLPAGFRLPRTADGTFGAEPVSTEAGLAALRGAFARLRDTAPTRPNPALGRMTHEEWRAINLRHAELHLSFFLPGQAAR